MDEELVVLPTTLMRTKTDGGQEDRNRKQLPRTLPRQVDEVPQSDYHDPHQSRELQGEPKATGHPVGGIDTRNRKRFPRPHHSKRTRNRMRLPRPSPKQRAPGEAKADTRPRTLLTQPGPTLGTTTLNQGHEPKHS